jgi:tetratricopeptide (TPR) repeat protein
MSMDRLRHSLCSVALAILCCGAAELVCAESNDVAADRAYQAGAEAMRKQRHDDAITAFERAAELRPMHVQTWHGLGIARSAVEDWDGAIRAYERVIEIEPDYAKAHHNIANIHFRRGDYESAGEGYRRALELNPDYVLAAFHYGWTLRQLNRPEEAERTFRRCLEIPAEGAAAERTRVDCRFGLGSLRQRAGDFETSAKMMEQVLSVHPTHPEARYYLGIAYRQLGRLEEAERELEFHRKMLSARRKRAPVFDMQTDP